MALVRGLGVALMASMAAGFAAAQDGPVRVYVGTYTGGDAGSEGIYLFDLDEKTGALSNRRVAAKTTSPSFLAIHPSGRFLYSVNEAGGGSISGFTIDPATGNLSPINSQSSRGEGPCHLVVDSTGKHVLAANYGGGSAIVLPIGPDGALGEATSFVQHQGKGVNPRRQDAPHAHSINLDAAGRFAVVADLGLDQVLVYRYDAEKGTLTPNDPPFTAVAPGSGPRHFAFHPNGRHAYVINEMNSTVTAFAYHPERGVLTELQTISTLPEPRPGNNSTAEIVVHPSGKFVYGSNRGHDSIAAFAVDESTGKLTAVEQESTQGKTPRNFAITPNGQFLLAENSGTNTIVVFKIDPNTGALEPTGAKVEVPMPVCVKFLVPKKAP